MTEDQGFTYKKAGVDVEAGNRAVDLLKERLKSTQHPLVLGGLGGFGGAMRLPRLKDPVLVAGTDGVGTKIEVARAVGRLDTIGIDLVAMSVNDVSACGAVPLFFLDYLVVGKVVPEEVATIVAGVDEGCLQAQCVLLGGETAEHPGQFAGRRLRHGRLRRRCRRARRALGPAPRQDGDALVGIGSSGLHSNGFSLVRHLLKEHADRPGQHFLSEGGAFSPGHSAGRRRWATCSSCPPPSTAPRCATSGHAGGVHAAAHITGGGFPDNVGRAVPRRSAAELDLDSWSPPPVYLWLHSLGVSPTRCSTPSTAGWAWCFAWMPLTWSTAWPRSRSSGLEAWSSASAPRGDGAAVRYRGHSAVRPLDLIGCGALNLDLIFRPAARRSRCGTNWGRRGRSSSMDADCGSPCDEALAGLEPTRSAGGQAANTIHAMARLGYRAAMLGACRRDDEVHLLVNLRRPRAAWCAAAAIPAACTCCWTRTANVATWCGRRPTTSSRRPTCPDGCRARASPTSRASSATGRSRRSLRCSSGSPPRPRSPSTPVRSTRARGSRGS